MIASFQLFKARRILFSTALNSLRESRHAYTSSIYQRSEFTLRRSDL